MSRRYIVKQRARIDTITGPVNLPYGTEVETVGDYLTHQGNRLCAVTSRKAHLYFAPDDDGQGRERGALTMAITRRLEKRDRDQQRRWDLAWEDPVCQKHRNLEHEDHFLWGHTFYEAPVEDLRHIAALIGARG